MKRVSSFRCGSLAACALLPAALLPAALLVVACEEKATAPPAPTPASQVSSAPQAVSPVVHEKPVPIPVGYPLPILPGKGVGPVRFGARLDTVERLIGAPCDDLRPLPPEPGQAAPAALGAGGGTAAPADALCRYVAHALEFELHAGVLTRITIPRMDRPFSPDGRRTYGIFNGRFEQGVAPGMYMSAVQEKLGAPKSVVKRDGSGPNRTEEVHEYAGGLRLEYDRLPNGNLVLGGVILEKAGS
jgi:hypothetical protein